MYIIGKGKDYYDSVGAQFGIDKGVVYKRDLLEVKDAEAKRFWAPLKKVLDNHKYYSSKFHFPNPTKFTAEHAWFLIFFCGKCHVGLMITYKDAHKDNPDVMGNDKVVFLYGNDLLSPIEEKAKEPLRKSRWNRKVDNPWEQTLGYIKDIESIDYTSLAFEYNTPLFFIGLSSPYRKWDLQVHINPMLDQYEFYKVKDPATAFQEIQQYISGVLGVDARPMVVTEDKYKIIGAGFDLKTSFRKDPGKPKPRKSKKV